MKPQLKVAIEKEKWVKDRLEKMTLRQCIAQLLHVPAWSTKDGKNEALVLDLIKKYGIGGVIFFQGTPLAQAAMTNAFQAASDIPLMISMDAEWGLGMRLDDAPSFPYQMTLGALQNEKLIYQMGAEIARQCKRLGVQVNFAPVVDINNNAANPVIGFRSFGDDKIKVAEKSLAYMKGLQDNGVMACAKHFPGHGDTALDSHFTLPIIDKSIEELMALEWYPFKMLIEQGLQSVMMGHLFVPQIEKRVHYASSISKSIIKLLQEKLNFNGLLFTDALDMKSVANYFPTGQLELEALKAGNDVLLFVKDVPAAIEAIEKGVQNGAVSQKDIIAKCRKLLNAKFDLGLWNLQPVELKQLQEDLHTPKSDLINQQVAKKSLTLIGTLPDFLNKKIATLALTPEEKSVFQIDSLAHHSIEKAANSTSEKGTIFQRKVESVANASGTEVTHFGNLQEPAILSELSHHFDVVLVAIHGLKVKNINDFGLTEKMINTLQLLTRLPNIVLCLFGSPYILEKIYSKREAVCPVIIAYQENRFTQEEVAEFLFENHPITTGRLPVWVDL